jgi:hypothetical protein
MRRGGRSSRVERGTFNLEVVGSIPIALKGALRTSGALRGKERGASKENGSCSEATAS